MRHRRAPIIQKAKENPRLTAMFYTTRIHCTQKECVFFHLSQQKKGQVFWNIMQYRLINSAAHTSHHPRRNIIVRTSRVASIFIPQRVTGVTRAPSWNVSSLCHKNRRKMGSTILGSTAMRQCSQRVP